MNRLNKLFESKKEKILNIYFTAGHPQIDSLESILTCLQYSGVDIVEIGMPYSDPMADGETIQNSSEKALANGMNLKIMFEQLDKIKSKNNLPIILMGYLNQVLQYGMTNFLNDCQKAQVDGLIIPDLPMDEYESEYQKLFITKNISISFLVTPQTSNERILKASQLSTGFLYVVSRSSITGSKEKVQDQQFKYFKKVNSLKGDTPSLIGFGIHDKTSFNLVCPYANGAIIGSQFIRTLEENDASIESINRFITSIIR